MTARPSIAGGLEWGLPRVAYWGLEGIPGEWIDGLARRGKVMTRESHEYLVQHRGKAVGPFDLEQLKRKISMGTLNARDRWSSDNGRTWNGGLGDLVQADGQAGGSGDDTRNGEPDRGGGGEQSQAGGPARPDELTRAGRSAAPEWHYTFQGQQLGPVTKREIQDLVDSGQLTRFDLVWKKGMKKYVPVTECFTPIVPPSPDAPPLPPDLPVRQPPIPYGGGEVPPFPMEITDPFPGGSRAGDPQPPTELIACGYIFAFLLPLVGFVLGIVTYAKGSVGHGISQIGISIFMTFIYMFVTATVIRVLG